MNPKLKLIRRVRGRITEENYRHLQNASKRRGSSQSKEINAALACYYSHERDDRRDSDIYDRLDLMLRHNHRHSRDMNLITEVLSLFIQYFFTMAPNQNAGDNDVRAVRGVKLLNQFIDQLGLKMKGGGKTFKNALEDVLVTEDDFFKLDEIALLTALSKKKSASPKKETQDA
jgi:hypothetical protein